MPKQQLIIYCDESDGKGQYYSHFYGGALIQAADREAINKVLNDEKASQNLHKEVKWTYITEQYEAKYIAFINSYLDLIAAGRIKLRVMFSQNIYVPTGLKEYQIDNQYFLLYYQLIKHAFGLRYCNPGFLDDVHIAIYLDDIPDCKERFDEFKKYLSDLSDYPVFKRSKIHISRNDITDVGSHDHVILQGLDIIVGAMQSRLNNKHLIKPEGKRFRGKRTRAKERVYKHINARIREIYPGFNIGVSTAIREESDRWTHPYRHWNFVPSEHRVDLSRGKRNNIAPLVTT